MECAQGLEGWGKLPGRAVMVYIIPNDQNVAWSLCAFKNNNTVTTASVC